MQGGEETKEEILDPKKEKALRYGAAFRLFDRGLTNMVYSARDKLTKACDKVQTRILSCEKKANMAFALLRQQCDRDLDAADGLVQKELRSKVIISQWTNAFLSASREEYLDPISFAFARFSLNMCLCYTDVSADYILQSKVHILLVGLMTFESELIVGPALMATMHISLYPELKPELILAGVLPALLKLFVNTESQHVLTQASKLCASLALHPPNKGHLVNSGVLHAILDLTGGAHKVVNKFTQLAAATAVANCIYGSDTNRGLLVELDGIRPIMSAIRLTADDDIILQCVKAIANITYCNGYTAAKFLNVGAETVLVEVLQSSDVNKLMALVHATMVALANFCYSEAAQSHIASGGAIDCAVLVAQNCGSSILVAEASNLMNAIAWNNTGNKSMLAARGCCETLVNVLIKLSSKEEPDDIVCFERAGAALASLMLYHTNQEKLIKIGAVEKLVKIAKRTSRKEKLGVIGMILTALTPSPEEILRCHTEECMIPVERYQAFPALKKIKLMAFPSDSSPNWINSAMKYLSLTDFELSLEAEWVKSEFTDKLMNYKELWTNILPDSSIFADNNLKSLVRTIY